MYVSVNHAQILISVEKPAIVLQKYKWRWFLLNVKAAILIFLVVFAAAATTLMLEISNSQILNQNMCDTESNSIIQIDDDLVEPQKEIDTPGMPT